MTLVEQAPEYTNLCKYCGQVTITVRLEEVQNKHIQEMDSQK